MFRLIRTLDDLKVYWQEGEPWFEAREVAQLIGAATVKQVTAGLSSAHRRTQLAEAGPYKRSKVLVVDGEGLASACRRQGNITGREAREYLKRLTARQGRGMA